MLQRVSQHPNSKVEELIPKQWNIKFKRYNLMSDLEATT
ncbi:hypothetical protein [Parashewanella spongiae]